MHKFKIAALVSLLVAGLFSQAALAQTPELAYKPTTTFHGESAPLSVLALNPVPVSPENGQLFEAELEELFEAYEPPYQGPMLPTPFVQNVMPRPSAAVAGASFEGPGTGLGGFTLTGAPPDMTLAVGPNHVVAWVNSQYAVFNKTGTVLVPPTNGNALFAGMGGVCDTTNRGDPILQYDRLAQRWILSQFAFATSGGSPAAPYLQCFAISTTTDPTGSYYRYSVQFSATSPSGFNDYGKLGVWPDGYYTAYNMFGGSPAGGNTGAGLCASDRVKMLAGDPTATTLCAPIAFYGGGASFLPADLDGATLPSTTSQGGIFLRLSTAPALRIVKLKPNFTTGTVTVGDGFGGASTSFVNLALPTTTRACNGGGGSCIAQPGTINLLDTLGDRLMYRLAYRNRSGVESMVVTHAVDLDGAGARGAALRWYEIRNPLGNPADPVVANRPVIYQNGTYDPGANSDRWMGSIAMDKDGNMMAGYSIASTLLAVKPSIAVAGRLADDPLNTLQAELVAHTGTGSQTGTLTRWGDYSTMQVDPADDSTFWYVGQYLASDGTFNWRSRIVSYKFPGQAELSIGNASLIEGNSGTSNMQFTITRSSTQDAVSVTVNTSNGTATTGSDYTAVTSQVVNFTAGGAATATVSVPIIGDTVLEPDETFTVTLSSPTMATIATAAATGTILNDDSASIAINNVTLAEGNSGTTNFVFNVTLTGAVQGGFTVPFSTSNGTATQPSDYVSTSGTLTFAGSAGGVRTITVPVVGDTILEPNETFNVNLGAPSNAAVTTTAGSGLGTITNDDAASIAISDVTLAEGNSGTTNFVFNVTLTGAVQGGFTVPFSTSNGTATQPSDYAGTSGTLTFTGLANEVKTITVPVVGDTNVEPDETFTVNLGAPSNAAITTTDGSGLGTIVNDDFAMVTISDVTMTEGNVGFKNFVFTATLDRAVPGSFSITYFTVDGTATQPSDYTGASGVLAFNGTSGETRIFFVSVSGDTVLEPDETFSFNFGTPSSALVTVASGGGIGTISNDDAASIAISDVTLAEGNGGTTNFVFNVTLTGAVQGGFTLPYSTANGTATQPSDYTSTSGTLTFTGSAGEVKTITVPVVGDTILEPNETFNVNLGAPSNAAITTTDGTGLGTITNDDAASIAISDVTLAEGSSGTTNFVFNVTLTGAVQGGFALPYSTANGTATQPSDYASTSGTLTFTGSASEVNTITVPVVGDTILEPNETFNVNLGAPSNAAITTTAGSGLGTINNDDAASIAVNNVSLAEGNSGTTNFVFNVSLTGAVQAGFTLPYSTTNGTATQPSDYASTSGTLTFTGSAAETRTIAVPVVGDTILEPNETFNVNLGAPSNAAITVSAGSGLGTITNDDVASIAINNISLAEGNSGTTNFVFNVSLTGAVQGGFTVPYSTANGTATQPSDYASTSGTLTFVGSASEVKTITVPVVGDLIPELDETFFANLVAPSNAAITVSQAQGTATIVNDDLFADVSVTMTDGISTIVPGDTSVYTVTVTNTSTLIDVAAVQIVQTVPASLINITWTCTGSGGATCPATGTGALSQTRAMPAGGSLVYLVSARVDPATAAPPASVITSVTATVLAPHSDPTTANNTASDSNTLILDVIFRNGFD